MEFKDHQQINTDTFPIRVLIESDWNLKQYTPEELKAVGEVLIESDWNLKLYQPFQATSNTSVLIESDWNLKQGPATSHALEE